MNLLEFAIKMENEGETFYRIQAADNKENGLFTVFTALADEEKRHAKIIADFLNDDRIKIPDSNLPASSGIFNEKFKSDTKQKPEQLDAYRVALEKEKESIDLYRRLMENTGKMLEKNMYAYLIEQEESHYSTIESIIFHLEKAESWVESAEFGVREEY